jgi:TPR repeat protein
MLWYGLITERHGDVKIPVRKPLLFVLALLIGVPAAASDLEQATQAYQRGDYASAYKLMRPLAERGDPEAIARLGDMYAFGRGVGEDPRQAERWWRSAAEKGVTAAMANLATLYARGLGGLSQDWKEAARWFHMAAERGHAPSMLTLSDMYVNGVGVELDDVAACAWAALAARFLPIEDETKERAQEQHGALLQFISSGEQERCRVLTLELQDKILSYRRGPRG